MPKVCIITGTSKGLGKELSEYYLEKGFIVAGCSRNESSINHQNYIHYVLDVSNEQEVVSMVRDIAEKYNKIDMLINNAGIASMNHFVTTPFETAKEVFNTNFFGTFLFIREVAKTMILKKKGRIVNYTTVATPLKLEGEAIYAASKAAIENITKITAKELGGFGITVNAIGPTPIPTDLIKNVPKEKINALIERQSVKRFGNFNDVANVIDFFIDDKSEFITGQIIYLGGINN